MANLLKQILCICFMYYPTQRVPFTELSSLFCVNLTPKTYGFQSYRLLQKLKCMRSFLLKYGQVGLL